MAPDDILQLEFATLPELVREAAARRPGHPAILVEDRRLDYAGLDSLMDQIAAGLQREGVAPRDVVSVCAGTSIEYAALFLGALRAGATVAPLPPSATPEQIDAMRRDCAPKAFFDDARLATLDAWLPPAGTQPAPVAIQPDWAFNIIYSSGTTGTPKGIVHPQAMRWVHIQRAARLGYGPDAVTLLATPLYSNTTLVSFLPTVGLGGTVILMPKFDARRYLELAERHRVTNTMLVPVQYQRIMALPDFGRYDLSSFRTKRSTSAPLGAALKADIVRRWPGKLIDSYGLTEGGATFMLDCGAHPDKLHTVGVPAPGHEVRLLDDQGREVAKGEAGEIVGRSPGMMTGYLNQPALTRDIEWHDELGKRFLRTGDIGRFDEDGFLVLVDRKKDMIISGGFNIYPSDIEAVLRQHPGMAEVSVVGVPSEKWGETPVAFVVLKKDSTVEKAELLEYANSRLGKTQRLAAVEIVDALPRSAIGKVLKRELRASFRGKGL
ncbi:MAG: AMP-binding protein [Betaproteobacteria bacterium]|nr:AMP-binding protein [Betaproteobacteria bacterium]